MEQMFFSGYANIILKAYSDFEVNGINFKKGQLVTLLQNVETNFSYSEVNVLEKTGSKNVGAYSEMVLTSIDVSNVPSNKDLRNILLDSNPAAIWLPRIIQFNAENNESKVALPTIKNIQNLNVYKGNERIDFTYEEENKVITGLSKGSYLIYYEEEYHGISSLLNPKRLPYLTLEVIGYGNNFENENKKSVFQHIIVPRVALVLEPNNIFNTNITNFDLKFNVIDDKEIKINYGEI